MRVALVIERIEAWRGGAETSTIQFAQRAAQRGCEVTLVTTSRGVPSAEMSVLTIKVTSALRAQRTLLFARRAAAAVRHGGYDIVHAVTPCPAADLYEPRGGAVPEMLRRNVALRRSPLQRGVKRFRDKLNLKYRVMLRLERTLVCRRPPPMVVAISRYVARQFQEHYGIQPPQTRLVFNGVDPDTSTAAERVADDNEIRQQYDLARNERLALCVAHNFRLKGVAPLIEAIAALPAAQRRHIRVIIVGRDNPVSYLRLAERLGVSDRIVFAGSTERISAFYHAADMLVHPTYYDPCSRVVLEALTVGVPVITTRFNGAAEVMTDGRQGFVLDTPDDVKALADRIARLLDEPLREQCAAAAQRLCAKVGMDRHAEEIVKLYREIHEGHS
jgi:UDP-glucose:(heptosyl)LPS alpha-1,3-glucosyltransferase